MPTSFCVLCYVMALLAGLSLRENAHVMAECSHWKILTAAELARMLRSGLGRVGSVCF